MIRRLTALLRSVIVAVLLVLCCSSTILAAITDKYVTSSGAGSADGSSIGNALSWSSMITAINAGGTAGTRYNVFGAITGGTSAQTISGSGTSTSPTIIRGCGSVLGDGYQGRTNGNGPLITTNMPLVTYTSSGRLSVTGNFIQIESMRFTAAVGAATVTIAGNTLFTRSVADNSSTSGNANALSVTSISGSPVDFEATLTGASGGGSALVMGSAGARAVLGRITGGPNIGVSMNSSGELIDSLVYGSASHGVAVATTGAGLLLSGCTLVDNGGDGVNIITGSTALHMVLNNLITDNGGYGLNGVSSGNAVVSSYNRFDRNTSGAKNLATDWLAVSGFGDDTTSVLKAAEYNNAASRDYSLLATSPAKGIGLWSFRDIGALQRQEPAGGSSTANGNKSGGKQ